VQNAKVKPAYRGSLVLSEDPMVAVIDDVLTADEITHIIDSARGRIRQARVSLDDDFGVTPGRSGGNCWLRYDSDPVVREIGERIAGIVGIPLTHAEALQVIYYGPSQEYRPHFDSYDLSTPKGQRCCRRGGQRLVTGLVYLNEVEEGGATDFPKLGVSVATRPGRLVIFHDTGEDITTPHPDSLHAGAPVIRGEKWAFNIWFHARPMTEEQDFSSLPRPATAASPAVVNDRKSFTLLTNRADRLWRQAVRNIGNEVPDDVCFTYWDTYRDSEADLSDVGINTRVVKLVDRAVVNPLANKASLAESIKAEGLTDLAPATYTCVQDALKDNPADAVWFVKPIFGTGGKGMYCVPAERLADLELPPNSILQREVDAPLLNDGRKFTARIYLMIWNGEIRLFETGLTVTHGVPYREGSTDYAVQIDHRGYRDAASPVQIRPGFDDEAFVEHFEAQRELVQKLRPVLADCVAASDRDRYIILGVDTMIRRDHTVRLIEVNTFPNFIHTQRVNDTVNVPLFEATVRTITGGPDPRFEVI